MCVCVFIILNIIRIDHIVCGLASTDSIAAARISRACAFALRVKWREENQYNLLESESTTSELVRSLAVYNDSAQEVV